MQDKIKLSKSNLTVNGTRCGISISAGPWIEGVNPELVKLRAKRSLFPVEFREAFKVENNSDSMTDYFESDCIRLLPGHPLHAIAKSLAA